MKQDVEEAKQKNQKITITIKGQEPVEAVKGGESVIDVVKRFPDLKSALSNALVARVNGKVWDLFRPLEEDCQVELCDFEDPDG